MNKMKIYNKNILFILMLVLTMCTLLLFTGCNDKVSKVEDLYKTEDAKSVDINGTVVYKSNRYMFISDGTGIINVKNSTKYSEVLTGDTVSLSGKAEIVNGFFLVNDPSIKVKTAQENLYKAKETLYSNEVLESLKKNENHEPILINFTGVATWIGEIRGILDSKTNAYIYTTDSNKEFTMFTSSMENSFRMGDLIECTGFVISTNTDDKFGIEVEIDTSIPGTPVEEKTDGFDLHILELNDLHGYITRDDYGKNGLSNMSYLINQIRDENDLDDTVLIANGDMFQGTAISNISHGLTVIKAMNEMKFDCMTIGNHEFDWKIETVLNYFDGNNENGEANFPLLNSNIFSIGSNKLLGIDYRNIFQSTIVEREGIRVGVIGYIGDVYSSISYEVSKGFEFENNVTQIVRELAINMKDDGVDIIVVSIHGGNTSGIENYSPNVTLANMSYNGEYLIDAVINGHTHYKQTGLISRNNGVKMPVVQAGCNGAALGDITLTIDMEKKEVISSKVELHASYEVDNNYDPKVEEIITNAKEEYADVLNEIYGVAGETVSRTSDLFNWAGNVLCKATGANVSICNTGGIRSNGDIIKGENITIENMYMINPFDNFVKVFEAKGSEIVRFINSNSVFYGLDGVTMSELESSSKTYKVAIIDYVYYFDNCPRSDEVYTTSLTMREMLIEDLKLHDSFKPITNPEAKIGSLIK